MGWKLRIPANLEKAIFVAANCDEVLTKKFDSTGGDKDGVRGRRSGRRRRFRLW
uniref:Uncharacterized protein n=1 Tax=Cucumis melo TaxID=3656 RepID=A0A9I9CYD7_CUCME